jgi:beta-glucosidase
MIAYQAIDGIPCTANEWLLKTVLREEWGYDGIAITDWNNIGRMVTEQFVCSTIDDAVENAIHAGTDMSMATPAFPDTLVRCINNGRVAESVIDEIASRILRLKFELGLFDGKKLYPDNAAVKNYFGCKSHKEKALQSALEALVLLKNQDSILPFGDTIKRIAVMGPNADNMEAQLGDWSSHSSQVGVNTLDHPRDNIVTVLDGIKKRAGSDIQIAFCRGCSVVDDGYDDIEAAAEIARNSDVVVVVVGDTISLNGEGRDRATLDLTGKQDALLKAIHQTGTPFITIIISGKPLSISWIKSESAAIVQAWNPGMEGGTAIAKILFGDVNPSGKLTISFPQSVGQIPVYYNQIPGWHTNKYADLHDGLPLFPFGFGLSYTTFAYSNLAVSKKKQKIGDDVLISIDVENTGKRDGIEIVQLYIRDLVSTVTLPVKQLKGFTRANLKAGEKKRVEFILKADLFSLVNAECERAIEPGFFELMVGGSSQDSDLQKIQIELIE